MLCQVDRVNWLEVGTSTTKAAGAVIFRKAIDVASIGNSSRKGTSSATPRDELGKVNMALTDLHPPEPIEECNYTVVAGSSGI